MTINTGVRIISIYSFGRNTASLGDHPLKHNTEVWVSLLPRLISIGCTLPFLPVLLIHLCQVVSRHEVRIMAVSLGRRGSSAGICFTYHISVALLSGEGQLGCSNSHLSPRRFCQCRTCCSPKSGLLRRYWGLHPDHVIDGGSVGQTNSASALYHTFDEAADGYIKYKAVSCVIIKRLRHCEPKLNSSGYSYTISLPQSRPCESRRYSISRVLWYGYTRGRTRQGQWCRF